VEVSVFETNIRVLGGLISTHMLLTSPKVEAMGLSEVAGRYDGFLLSLATDLADRLLPAFATETDIPYGTVNLRHGVPINETTEASVAGGGTYLLEFILLSRLTGNPAYQAAALRASYAIYDSRTDLDLFGSHIDIQHGGWTVHEGGLGAGMDSYLEYLLKVEHLGMSLRNYEGDRLFDVLQASATKSYVQAGWLIGHHIFQADVIYPVLNSLSSWWPLSLVMTGRIEDAIAVMKRLLVAVSRHGFLPEGFNVQQQLPVMGQLGYPLRPEVFESLYYIYSATGDRSWLQAAYEMWGAIQHLEEEQEAIVGACGIAAVKNVITRERENRMESFFLSETLKYIYLMSQDPKEKEQHAFYQLDQVLFTTEAHLIPLSHPVVTNRFEDSDADLRTVEESNSRARIRQSAHSLSSCSISFA